ncbi:hypothetical protein PYH38_000028 [Sinorhizobium numidicum]|uniref:Uncharacterized protein n=2 Tax=Sinorhizobium numidicum TaxID=680248 RepID=A0ABY8CTF6_9HYPH|nr:methyltransferase [Sinorhizobium numidicum]WEX80747.1 hypothetical protein PYH38_000028 [Sinorhizobium numidicum]
MFGICRNPLYVGNVLIYGAVFVMPGDPWVASIGILSFLFMYQCIVHAEEDYLGTRFGEGYRAYCADVPRWIPRFGNFRRATEGMAFNVKRVIGKDYSTMSATLIALLSVEVYETLAAPEPGRYGPYLSLLATLIAFTGLMAAFVSFLRKRGSFRERKAV